MIKTRECSLAELQPKLNELVQRQLSNDDGLLFCSETHIPGSATDAQVITQRRIVLATIYNFVTKLLEGGTYPDSAS